jgi:beta-xylosidase
MPAPLSLARVGAVLAGLALLAGCSSKSGASPQDAGDPSSEDARAPQLDDAGSDGTVSTPPADASDDGAVADAPITIDATDAAPAPQYLNPVINSDFPDPFILRQGGTYYAFGTNAAGKNIQAARSTDLAHWTPLADALPTLPAWAAQNADLTWAPSILQRGPTSFVMYYTTRDSASGFQCISHAEASTPSGPYVDSTTSAFVCQVSGAQSLCGSIDPSPFVDTDGTAYLVWKSDENSEACSDPPRLWSAPLTSDGSALTGPPTQLLIMDETWQQPIIEGPSMTVVNGNYYLAYSANNYESAAYSMGYATCLSPTGPCENVSVNGPFVSSAGAALGPGGGEFFEDEAGGRWLVYHSWTAPTTTYAGGGARSMRVDRLQFDGGALSLLGPTTTPQTL